MVHLNKSKENDYIIFENVNDKKFYDFNEAKIKLESLLNTRNGKISETAIKLTIYSYYCCDIKIIDLPGITNKNESEKITKSICNRYCNRDNCITMVAVTASTDLDSDLNIKFINEIDPSGENTFCILTKIDLCDKNTLEFIKKKLIAISKGINENSVESLHNGFTIVRNRSESQNNTNESLAYFLKKEKDYFRSLFQFRDLSLTEIFGFDCLAEKMKKQLYKILIQGFPKIYEETKSKISDCQDEIQKFGNDYIYLQSESDSSKISYLNSLVSHFSDEIDCIFSGKLTKLKSSENLTNSSMKKLYYEFLEDYKSNQSENLPSKSMTNEEIIHIIKVNEGDGLSGFPQSEVIHLVLEKEIIKLRNKVKEFSEEIINIIVSSIKSSIESQFCRFPPLLERIEEIINVFLEGNFSKFKYLIESISEMHFNYFYLDEKSLSYTNLLEKIMVADNNMSDKDMNKLEQDFTKNYYNKLVEYIKFLANYYHSLIIRDLREQIPKITGEFLIKPIKNNLRFQLMTELKVSETASDLLKENSEVKKKREYYINAMKYLKEADKNLNLDDELKKLLKSDSKNKEKRKHSSVISPDDGETFNIKDQNYTKTEELNKREFSKNENSNSLKNTNYKYEEENKTYNDKKGFVTQQQTNVYNQEEFKNKDARFNQNQNKFNENNSSSLKDPKMNNQTNNIKNSGNSNNNLINVNTNINNKTYANDIKLGLGNSTNNNQNNLVNENNTNNNSRNMTNVNFKYDPKTNQIQDVNVKVDMDAETAYKLYQDNKKYLPTTQQVISGAKATGNVIQNSGILNDIGINNTNTNTNTTSVPQTKKKAGVDPLSFFGNALNKTSNNSDKSVGNNNTKKGQF